MRCADIHASSLGRDAQKEYADVNCRTTLGSSDDGNVLTCQIIGGKIEMLEDTRQQSSEQG